MNRNNPGVLDDVVVLEFIKNLLQVLVGEFVISDLIFTKKKKKVLSFNYPVRIQRCFDVYTTSTTFGRRPYNVMDIKIMLCAYNR